VCPTKEYALIVPLPLSFGNFGRKGSLLDSVVESIKRVYIAVKGSFLVFNFNSTTTFPHASKAKKAIE
jgi:hypothetical protein